MSDIIDDENLIYSIHRLHQNVVEDEEETDEDEDNNCKIECFQSMSDDFLLNMKQCRDMQILCDAKFEIDGKYIYAHKIVLASRSLYFRTMFTSHMKESYESIIKINNVSYEIFSSIIDFLYTAQIEISNENIECLFHLSNLYDIRQLQVICISYIYEHMTIYNCKNIYSLCITYMCCTFDLIEKVHMFICNNFGQIIMKNLIKSWTLEDISYIFYDIHNCINSVRIPTPLHQKKFFEWLEMNLTVSPKSLHINNCKFINHFHKVLFITGGFCDGGLINSPECLNLDYVTHQKHSSSSLVAPISTMSETNIIPSVPLKKGIAFAGCTSDGKNVFLLGGLINRDVRKLSNNVYMYSSMENTWNIHSTLPYAVEGIAALYRNERTHIKDRHRIYACGGRTIKEVTNNPGVPVYEYLKNLWVYQDESWVSLPPMNIGRASHGLVFYCNEIYAIGGEGQDELPLNSVEIYNPELKEWRMGTPLNISRTHLCCVVSTQYIYAIGGNMAERSHEFKHHALHQYAPQERYSMRSNKWEIIQEKSLPNLLCFGGISDDTRIVICGGKTSLRENNTILKRRLDGCSGKSFWHPLAPLVRKRWGHMVALLHVPVYQDCAYI